MGARTFDSGHTVTNARQQEVLRRLERAGRRGLTSREMARAMSPGDVSGVNGWGGAFTVLRQAGHIVALDEERLRHHVYVLPDYVAGRATWPGYHHRGHCVTCTCQTAGAATQEGTTA